MKKRWVLMNPGPVNVSGRVRRALLKPDICHRESEFSSVLASIRRRLLSLFGVSRTHTVAVFTGSGTAALEAMLSSFAEKNKRVLVLSNGVYGARLRRILELHGSPVTVLESGIGSFPSAARVESALKKDRSIRAVALVHHETSSGMLNPLSQISALAKRRGLPLLVDAVSSLGGEKVALADVAYCAGSAGKCLHGFPGVSFVFVSKKEAKKLAGRRARTLYLDLRNTLEMEEALDTPFTPAVQLFYAFEEALKELQAEGLDTRIRRYERLSALLAAGFKRLGLRFVVEKESRSHVLTALWMPPSLRYGRLHASLKKAGFIIYAGQSSLSGKIFRVSNLGAMTPADIRRFLRALGRALKRRS